MWLAGFLELLLDASWVPQAAAATLRGLFGRQRMLLLPQHATQAPELCCCGNGASSLTLRGQGAALPPA